MTNHLSLRLVWHDRAWDGHICDRPETNVFCSGCFSVQGDYIRSNKVLSWEKKNRGVAIADIYNKEGKLPPCTWTSNTYSARETPHRHVHPFISTAQPQFELFPPYSAGTWSFDQMYEEGRLITDAQERKRNIDEYFRLFEPGRSLVFTYLNYDNPLTSENKRYVLVGVSRLFKLGDYHHFKGLNKFQINRYSDLVWSKNVIHSFPDEGVRIPYQEYLKQDKPVDNILFELTGEIVRRFKYVSRPLTDDDACELIERLTNVIRRVKLDNFVSGDWDSKISWLDSVLEETWHNRGLYPGLSNILSLIGVNHATLWIKDLSLKMHEKLLDYVIDCLEGKKKDTHIDDKSKRIWKQYNPTKKQLMKMLAFFDLTEEQLEKIISEKNEETAITSTLEQIAENPYIIAEEYVGSNEDDIIGFYKIDNGIFPEKSLGTPPIMEPDDRRRVRALMIEKLRSERNTGNCFLELNDILEYVQQKRIGWRKCIVTYEKLLADKEFYEQASKLKFVKRYDKVFVYLAPVFEDEQKIRSVLERLLPKIHTSPGIDWKEMVYSEHNKIPEKVYEKVVEEQAKALETAYKFRFSIITGAAGTGKTTVVNNLIQGIKQRQPGSTFLLLAPTGKARGRLHKKTGIDAKTIHRALMEKGWLAKNNYRFVNSTKKIEAQNIIIDECSMIDLELLAHLFKAIDWNQVSRLILVGDANQLPPIGFGRPFFDIIEHFKQHNLKERISELRINCRQFEQESDVLKLASAYTESPDADYDSLLNNIEKQSNLVSDLSVVYWNNEDDIFGLIDKEIEKLLQQNGASCLDSLLDIKIGKNVERSNTFAIDFFQILSPYRGEYFGTAAINDYIQRKYHAESISNFGLMEGLTTADKVMQVVNNRIWFNGDMVEVFNGQLGYVAFSNRQSKKFLVKLDDNGAYTDAWLRPSQISQNLELGYAITVHKAQGSDFDYVFLILPKKEALLSRELLYTALTRSKAKLVIFLQQDIGPLQNAMSSANSAIRRRNTSIFSFTYIKEEEYFENSLIHRTKKGEYVRSKSEVIIANELFSHDISYKYEERLYSRDHAEWKLPDFTIFYEGEIFYWEHLGRLEHDPQYVEDWERKKEWYKKNGYFDRLIWSDEIGGFDTKKVTSLIQEKIVRQRSGTE